MGRIFGVCLLLLAGACSAVAQNTASYSLLRPPQRRLIDDWFSRSGAAAGKFLDPAEHFEQLPFSAKITFASVTHALLSTKLTDKFNQTLAASAMELIARVDDVAGRIPGAGTDEQFRIYVRMNPGVLDLLRRSTQFKRRLNNLIYHRGYPICFRSVGGTPSIQISLSSDATRADIDVDYRSTRFPVSLVNGHFTVSNSDISFGKNATRYNRQYGSPNWPLAIAQESSLKGVHPAEAVYEFLKRWLVERKPYESTDIPCMELERGKPTFAMLQNMVTGNVSSLKDVTMGVSIASDRLKTIKQTHHGMFALYDVRDDLAEQFKCRSQPKPGSAPKSRSFGNYIAAIFRIKAKGPPGHIVATVWQRERDYWKLISYNVDPRFD